MVLSQVPFYCFVREAPGKQCCKLFECKLTVRVQELVDFLLEALALLIRRHSCNLALLQRIVTWLGERKLGKLARIATAFLPAGHLVERIRLLLRVGRVVEGETHLNMLFETAVMRQPV